MTLPAEPAGAGPSTAHARRPGLSLRPDQLIILIGALLLVTVPLVCGYFVTSLYQSEVAAIRNRLEIPAQAMAHSTGAIARNGDSALRNIQAVLQTTTKDEFATEALRQTITYRDSLSIAISRITVYDKNGTPFLNSTSEKSVKGSVAAYDFFRRQANARTDQLLVSDLVPDPVSGVAEIIMSRRLADANGNFLGVAAVFVEAAYLQQIFDSLQMPWGISITAFNRDGHVVVRSPPVRLGDVDLSTDFTTHPIFTALSEGPAGGSFARFRTLKGMERFIAGIGGKDAPFIIAAGWDADAALASWQRESFGIAGGALAGLAVTLVLLAYLRRQIRRNDELLVKVSNAEQRQRHMMTALPDAVAIIDESLQIEFANPVAERIFGYAPGEMNGMPLAALMSDDVKAQDEESARNIVAGGEEGTVRILHRDGRRKDGSTLPVEISTCRYRAPDGSKLISVMRDVTIRAENDRALRRSRENLARAQRLALLGSFERDLHSGVLECSEQFLRMWGFDPAVTHPTLPMLMERVAPQDREAFIAARVAVLSGKTMPTSEFRVVLPNGEERILNQEYSADFAADGRPTRLFGITQDITERKAAEMELRRSRENLARAQRIAAVGSFDRDLLTGRGEWSDEFLKIWGLNTRPPDEATQEVLSSLVHPEDREKFLAGREAAMRNEAIKAIDFRITRPDGAVRVLHREYGVLYDDSGKAIRLFGTVQDITENKAIETELRRSREDLARAQRIAGIGSFSRDVATGKTEWSEEFLRVWGLEAGVEAVTAETLAAMVHPADRKVFLQGRDAALTNTADSALDFHITRPDGEERILHREYGVLFDENGKAVRMFGTVQDITERKRNELALRRSQENLAHSQRIAGLGSFERDLVTGKWEWSDELYRLHGIERNDPHVDVASLRKLVHPEDRGIFDQVRDLAARGKPIPPADFRIIRPDGIERILHRECELVRDPDGKPIRLVATLQDITERRKVELEMRRSRENMARAQRLACIGSFERDLVTGDGEWSDEMYRIMGLEIGTPWSPAELIKLVHPDDRERFRNSRADELLGKAMPPLEYRITRPDGVERIVRRESAVTLDAEKRPIRLFGTLQDITERKQAEIELLQSRESMARAQQIANMGSFDHDLQTGRITWSDQMYAILGVEKGKEAPSWETTLRYVHPEDREAYIESRERVTEANSDLFEFRIIRPDGQERVLCREVDVHFSDDGRPMRIFGTMHDVTQRVVAAARERELERQLLHSQKLEALGTLAGGIAHDLNNTLVPIMALSKLTARRFESGTPVRNNLDTIYEASERARDLVRRVLAFSRKEEPDRQQEANLAEVVREALKLMRATVPTSIQLDSEIADVPSIRADASQIHQVITNLVSNAAGAMTNGMGTITVSLGLASVKKAPKEIRLSVADTGCGMDEATQQRIFEPFFTTKAVGQGTGLGLSIVHGIVSSHGGRIEVKSAPGKGTRLDLYFPLPGAEKANPEAKSSRPAA
ncbi:MAG TPA: PAS domain-containing protein [Stellaceae bacterium]|nr:PAS domain-containing protein [Stellaceae bacterium]